MKMFDVTTHWVSYIL